MPYLKDPTKTGPKAEPEVIRNLLFDKNVIEIIVKWTIVKIEESRMCFSHEIINELHDIDDIEMKPFLGLSVYLVVVKIQCVFNV